MAYGQNEKEINKVKKKKIDIVLDDSTGEKDILTLEHDITQKEVFKFGSSHNVKYKDLTTMSNFKKDSLKTGNNILDTSKEKGYDKEFEL